MITPAPLSTSGAHAVPHSGSRRHATMQPGDAAHYAAADTRAYDAARVCHLMGFSALREFLAAKYFAGKIDDEFIRRRGHFVAERADSARAQIRWR